MLEVYEAHILDARIGMSMADFNILIGQPETQTQEQMEDGSVVDVLTFERVEFKFVNQSLASWKVTKPIISNPLDLALEGYLRALDLDEKGRVQKNVEIPLTRLKYRFVDEGSNCFELQDYACATHNFSKAIEVGKMPIINHVDTIVVYYAGLAAQLAGDYHKAIDFYKKTISLDYTSDGNLYYNIYEAYLAMDMAEEGLQYLEEGFTKFPGNQSILIGLINYYLALGDDPTKVLDFLKKAIEMEPENVSLYHAKGTLLDKLDDQEGAQKAYETAIEINPDFFDATFNLGVLFFNTGVRYLEEANKIPARDFDKYDAMMEKANAEFMKSIPYMERCLEINPNDQASLETLRNLYFRFRTKDEKYNERLKEIDKMLGRETTEM